MSLFSLWRALFAALIAMLFARVDAYVERRGWGDTAAGRAWRTYRSPDARTMLEGDRPEGPKRG